MSALGKLFFSLAPAGGLRGGARGEERGRGARWRAVRGEERVSEPKHTVVRGASVRSRKHGAGR